MKEVFDEYILIKYYSAIIGDRSPGVLGEDRIEGQVERQLVSYMRQFVADPCKAGSLS
tara:strand:+ start:507 stop:680 length:174 start_codon:yes stop_codon:yes gene_type:complete